MGSPRECTRILGLEGFRVEQVDWEGATPGAGVCVWIQRRGIRGATTARAVDDGRGACAITGYEPGTTCLGPSTG